MSSFQFCRNKLKVFVFSELFMCPRGACAITRGGWLEVSFFFWFSVAAATDRRGVFLLHFNLGVQLIGSEACIRPV